MDASVTPTVPSTVPGEVVNSSIGCGMAYGMVSGKDDHLDGLDSPRQKTPKCRDLGKHVKPNLQVWWNNSSAGILISHLGLTSARARAEAHLNCTFQPMAIIPRVVACSAYPVRVKCSDPLLRRPTTEDDTRFFGHFQSLFFPQTKA